MRSSCKGSLSLALYVFFLPRKPILCISNSTRGCLLSDVSIEYVIVPVSLTELCLFKHFTIGRLTKNLVRNIIDNVASSYQVNLAKENPNITENYINSLVFTCQHWVSAMLI